MDAQVFTGEHTDHVYPAGTDVGGDPTEHSFLGLVDAHERVARDDGLHLDEDDGCSADDEIGLSPGNALAGIQDAVAPTSVAVGNDVFAEASERSAVEA